MTLEDLGNIGEFVGAVGVVISLLYLAIQIRGNTRTTRAEIFQGLTLAVTGAIQETGRSPQATHVFLTGQRDLDALTDEEQGQFRLLINGVFMRFENAHYQYRRGTLEDELWDRYRALISSYLSRPGVRKWWKSGSRNFSAPFKSLIAELLSESESD